MPYNHKEAIKNLTPEERYQNLVWAMKGYRQAICGKKITCRGCNKDFKLIALYLCFFCGSYFCKACGKIHFGDRSNHE